MGMYNKKWHARYAEYLAMQTGSEKLTERTMEQGMPTIGIVILHYGDVSVTDTCIRSIRRLDGQESIRIIVVDNEVQKSKEKREKLSKHYGKVENLTVLTNTGAGGFSEANNLGYLYAREVLHCEWIIVSNNDIEFVQRDFIERLERSAEAHPDAYILAPDIIRNGTGEHQNPMDTQLRTREQALFTIRTNELALKMFPLSYLPVKNMLERAEKGKEDGKAVNNEMTEGIVPFGACLIFTPQFVREAEKAFEPETQFYYEEYILALRCKRNGWKICYEPDLELLHESGAATKGAHKKKAGQVKFLLERTAAAARVYLDYLDADKED